MTFTVPGYRIDQLIGYGSHAEVWSGHIEGTAEAVALKRIILPPHGDPGRAAELIRSARAEAALLTALEHPSLIRLRQYVQTPAAAVLVMELAEGGSMAQLLRRRGRLSPAEVSAGLSPIAAALAFAHSEGVLHGDVSAANILFSAIGQPKLADLGVARMLIGRAGPERSLGTPAYVDPVVAAGGAAGAASDVFSLAAVALHCVTGTGPWHSGDAADLRAVLARAATGVIEDLPGKLAGCPEPMARVLSRALDPEPHRRGSAAEFALDLGASVPSSPVVLAAGRILPSVGRHSVERRSAEQPSAERPPAEQHSSEQHSGERHSVERHDPAGLIAVPADLTHVARLQVRPEQVEPPMGRRTLRGLADRVAGRPPAIPFIQVRHMGMSIAFLGIALLGITALILAAVRSPGRPIMAAAQRTAQPVAPGSPATAMQRATRAQGAAPVEAARSEAAVTSRQPTVPARTGGPAAGRSTVAEPSSTADEPTTDTDPDTVLRRLADRRAEAFARNRPDLLAAVYQSRTLLIQDRSQLSSRVPAGCGLVGLRTSYRNATVTSADPQRLELQVIASQPPASLVCAGTVRSRTEAAGPTRLVVRLVRVEGDFRIASQRPGR